MNKREGNHTDESIIDIDVSGQRQRALEFKESSESIHQDVFAGIHEAILDVTNGNIPESGYPGLRTPFFLLFLVKRVGDGVEVWRDTIGALAATSIFLIPPQSNFAAPATGALWRAGAGCQKAGRVGAAQVGI